MTARFTLGIIFSADLEHVYLLRRDHPEFQAGKLNGVGGKLEPGETWLDCMAREAVEEAGYFGDWECLGSKRGVTRGWGEYDCGIFYSVMGVNATAPHTCESEPIERIAVKDVPAFRTQMIPPLPLIIHAALEHHGAAEHERFRVDFLGRC